MKKLPLSISIIEAIHSECTLKTSRSGGPGGQHVNKVETKVILKWNISTSEAITEKQKVILFEKLKNKINSFDELVITEQSARDQKSNKEKIFKKLNALLQESLKKKKLRKATRPTKQSIEKKKISKKNRSKVKSMRKPPKLDS